MSRLRSKRSVVVNTKTGRSFRGVLWSAPGLFTGPYLVLRDAVLLEGNSVMPIDGEVVIHGDNIDFTQLLNATVEATTA